MSSVKIAPSQPVNSEAFKKKKELASTKEWWSTRELSGGDSTVKKLTEKESLFAAPSSPAERFFPGARFHRNNFSKVTNKTANGNKRLQATMHKRRRFPFLVLSLFLYFCPCFWDTDSQPACLPVGEGIFASRPTKGLVSKGLLRISSAVPSPQNSPYSSIFVPTAICRLFLLLGLPNRITHRISAGFFPAPSLVLTRRSAPPLSSFGDIELRTVKAEATAFVGEEEAKVWQMRAREPLRPGCWNIGCAAHDCWLLTLLDITVLREGDRFSVYPAETGHVSTGLQVSSLSAPIALFSFYEAVANWIQFHFL